MVRTAVLNLLLNIVTLTLWRFWGKTRVRRQVWAGTVAWGDAAEYTGTGRELLLGFVIVVIAVFMPVTMALGAAQAAIAGGNPVGFVILAALQLLIAMLSAAGLYRARRYQLSRTLWRGIRGGQTGEAWRYGLLFLWVGMLSVLTLGWAWPWADMRLARYRMGNTTFGDGRFECDATARPLYGRFAVLWLCATTFLAGSVGLYVLAIPFVEDGETAAMAVLGASVLLPLGAVVALGLPWAWYRVAFLRRLAAGTRFDGMRFELQATTGSLIRLALGNWTLSVLSLGILRPWAALRTFRYACARLRTDGEPDWSRVHQRAGTRSRMGEGLATVFDGADAF